MITDIIAMNQSKYPFFSVCALELIVFFCDLFHFPPEVDDRGR